MFTIFAAGLLALVAARDDGIEIPSNVAIRAIGVRGQFMCGTKPLDGARVRLYRVAQFGKDNLHEILDEKFSLADGKFKVEGSTKGYPRNETELYPWISVHHQCEQDMKSLKQGYRRFNMRIPDSYVHYGERSHNAYDFGTLNLEPGTHGEYIDKHYIPNPNAKPYGDKKPAPGQQGNAGYNPYNN
ncbi:unnamed protein product, partial [Mesorhabditis spiculigera]